MVNEYLNMSSEIFTYRKVPCIIYIVIRNVVISIKALYYRWPFGTNTMGQPSHDMKKHGPGTIWPD
jgi:hypothetical protein